MKNAFAHTLSEARAAIGAWLAACVLLFIALPAQAELQGRELDGDLANGPEAFFDTELNITWLRAASTSAYDWHRANLWAEQDRFGISGWRLPVLVDIGRDGCAPPGATTFGFSFAGPGDCGYNSTRVDAIGYVSELAELFYLALGNKAYYAPGTGAPGQPNWGLTSSGDFANLQPNFYWFGNAYTSSLTDIRWRFDMLDGLQFFGADSELGFAIAVRSGDVAAVPEPGAAALFLMGGAAVLLRRSRSLRQPAKHGLDMPFLRFGGKLSSSTKCPYADAASTLTHSHS